MKNKVSKEITNFEENFTDLMKMEQLGSNQFVDETIELLAKDLASFNQREAFKTNNDLFYFYEVVCFPYKNEVGYDTADDWISELLNHTLKRLIIDKAESTKVLTAVRLFHILWLGIQKRVFDEQFLLDNFINIYDYFDVKYEINIIPYSFIEKFYPAFEEEETKTTLKLGLTVKCQKLADAVFGQ